jgi:hypothetical protein
VVLPALSKSSALGFLQKFSEGGVPGGGIEPVPSPPLFLDPGWEKIWIRDKHPGTATLQKRMDPSVTWI